jgi:UDP-3-O-[3-hydroxymyristoyl] N-acetylglucosamine deacetylase
MPQQTPNFQTHERTLSRPVHFVGIGLHSGRSAAMVIHPAPSGTGIQFERTDVARGKRIVQAHWSNVSDTRLCTVLSNPMGVSVATVEHLMAALGGCGVDNAVVQISGPEVPAVDGSAMPFVRMLESVGTRAQSRPRHYAVVRRTIEISIGDSYAVAMPDPVPGVTVSIDFADRAVGYQKCRVELTPGAFHSGLASARTFGFLTDIQPMRASGRALGATLDNTVLVNRGSVVNPEGLRFADEFVRHKALDLVGDMSLLGVCFVGHVLTHRPSHRLNSALLVAMLSEQNALDYMSAAELSGYAGTLGRRSNLRRGVHTLAALVNPARSDR